MNVTGTLGSFSFPFEIAGQTVKITVPAGVQVTFPMPTAQVVFSADSPTTADSTQTSDA